MEEKNLKYRKFKEYLKKNDINYFAEEELHNEAQTYIFKSAVYIAGRYLPASIITDHTIYTIIRIQVGKQLANQKNKEAFHEYVNALNRHYKVFKYVLAYDGSLYLDAVVPTTNYSFEPKIIMTILDVIVNHLREEYDKIMEIARA